MSTEENGERAASDAQAAAMGDSASPLAELERLQQALGEAEERARGHWEQYLRAVAELDNVRKRAQRDIEAANRYGLERSLQDPEKLLQAEVAYRKALSLDPSSADTHLQLGHVLKLQGKKVRAKPLICARSPSDRRFSMHCPN